MSGVDPRAAARDAFDTSDVVREVRVGNEKMKAALQATKELVERSRELLRKTQGLLDQVPK